MAVIKTVNGLALASVKKVMDLVIASVKTIDGVQVFLPYSTNYSATGTQTISIPAGATAVTIKCIAAGGSGTTTATKGGGGAACSKKNSYSTSGLTGIYISVPAQPAIDATGADAFARENGSGGTLICLAKGGVRGADGGAGGAAASGTGDVKYSGGTAPSLTGGGAAGDQGAGSGSTPGSDSDGLSGQGNIEGFNGSNYGGGAGASNGQGAQGVIRLTWE